MLYRYVLQHSYHQGLHILALTLPFPATDTPWGMLEYIHTLTSMSCSDAMPSLLPPCPPSSGLSCLQFPQYSSTAECSHMPPNLEWWFLYFFPHSSSHFPISFCCFLPFGTLNSISVKSSLKGTYMTGFVPHLHPATDPQGKHSYLLCFRKQKFWRLNTSCKHLPGYSWWYLQYLHHSLDTQLELRKQLLSNSYK